MTLEPGRDRIAALDILRGVAVLGIIFMNIGAFAMPLYGYYGPPGYHVPGADVSGEWAAWATGLVLFDGKMRGLLSLLFGAGIVLLADRAAARGQVGCAAHSARMAVLAAIGLGHYYLIWVGDILFGYAMAGLILWPMVKRGAAVQAVAAGLCLALGMLLSLPLGMIDAAWLTDYVAGTNAEELQAYRQGWGGAFGYRIGTAAAWPVTNLLPGLLEVIAMMLAGMAAVRAGVLAGGWQRGQMLRRGAALLAAGLAGHGLLIGWIAAADNGLAAAIMVTGAPMWLPRAAMVLAYALLLLAAAPMLPVIGAPLAAAGRLSLSLYLLTSLVMTGLFQREALYGLMPRPAQFLVALGTAAMLLWLAAGWAAGGRRGPAEWLWRGLSAWLVKKTIAKQSH